MADWTLPTSVDVTQLTNAVAWLKTTKEFVDQVIITEMKKIPPMVGDAATNSEDPNKMDYQMTTSGAPQAVAASGPGVISSVGPTHFGLFPEGIELAQKHIGCYNSVITGLNAVSTDLANAIAATSYIIDNFKKVEDINATELARILQSPPYVPGADQPVSDVPKAESRPAYGGYY